MDLLHKWLEGVHLVKPGLQLRDEQAEHTDLQDGQLPRLQQGAQARRLADDLVRPCDGLGGQADRHRRSRARGKCTVLNYWVSVAWRGTSTVGLRNSRSVLPS